MAEATRTATNVAFTIAGVKGILATVSTFTTADTCTFTSGANGLGTILFAYAQGASANVSVNFANSTVTFGTTSATVQVFAIGY